MQTRHNLNLAIGNKLHIFLVKSCIKKNYINRNTIFIVDNKIIIHLFIDLFKKKSVIYL